LEVGSPQSAFRSRASSRQVAQDIQDVKCSDLQRLRPLVEIESPNQENDLKAQATVIRNLDQALPRSLSRKRCGKDDVKPAGFCRVTTRRKATCAFRSQSRLFSAVPVHSVFPIVSNLVHFQWISSVQL